jgi:uncharacterized protein YecE (DUF72 family)
MYYDRLRGGAKRKWGSAGDRTAFRSRAGDAEQAHAANQPLSNRLRCGIISPDLNPGRMSTRSAISRAASESPRVNAKSGTPMNLYVGTSGYSYKEWKGTFYPKALPPKQMLHYYGEHFRTVEVNYTFRRMPKASLLETWASAVPAEFQFVLKAPERITHIRRLKDVDDSVSYFLEVAGNLQQRLGPLLFQLPPNFKKDVPRLRAFLALLPSSCRVTMEFRHLSWFDDEVFGLLRDHRTALCIADDDDLEVPFVASADWGYLRLRRPEYDAAALKTWVKRVQQADWRDAFVFFKHEDEGKGPQLAKQFLELAR